MKKFLSFALVLVMLVALCGCDMLDYKKAMKAYDNGDYAEARDMFEALDDYKDSADLVKDCNYRLAKKAMDKEDFDKALSILEKLDDYKDSEEMVQECNYKLGLEKLEKGKYEEAAKLFEEAGSYKDAADQVKECSYQLALIAMEGEDQDAAIEMLTALGDYKDSADLLNELTTAAMMSKLAGDWTATLDISDLLVELVAQDEGDDDVKNYISLKSVMLPLYLEIDDSYEYQLGYDYADAMDLVEDCIPTVTDGMYDYIEDIIDAECKENNLTRAEFLEFFEVDSVDALVEYIYGEPLDEYLFYIFEDFIWYNEYTLGDLIVEDGKITVNDWFDIVNSMTLDAAGNIVVEMTPLNGTPVGPITFTHK